MTRQDLFTLYEHNAWASARAPDAPEGLTPEQFLRDLRNSLPSVRDTLAHILGAEWIWLRRWPGESPSGLLPASQFPSVAGLRDRFGTIERERRTFPEGLTQDRLNRPLQHRDTAGKAQRLPLVHSLLHVVNHGTYHPGQIATLVRQLGARPVSSDMSRFYVERGAAT